MLRSRLWFLIATGVVTGALTLRASDNRAPRAADVPRPPAAVMAIDAVAIPAGAEAMVIDGELAEEVWTRATAVTEFAQRSPSEGAAPSHATEVRVVFDQSALYISVRAMDPEPDKVVGLLTRRDDQSPSDWVSVLIDSYHDKRTAFEFGVNAVGVKYDRYWYDDSNNDGGWDAVWDVAAKRSPQGWRAEFRIPFSQLRFKAVKNGAAAADPDAALGFAVMRTVQHLNETVTWPLLARSASGFVSSFGELRGVTVAGGQKKLELVPYASSQVITAPVASENPLTRSPDPSVSAGVDLKYQVAPGLMLTGTINPDFGQVEADPAVVNLGAFETFFSERRPFFLEGSGAFSFGQCGDCSGIFYSRRIGREPHRFVDSPVDGYAVQPSNTTILGAVKLTGRIGQFSIGALNAITAPEKARLASGIELSRSRSPVEPTSSYSVVRSSRQFSDNSRVGFIFTSTNRKLVDELRFLPGAAVTGGGDWDWRLGKRFSFAGMWAGSTVRGSADAIDRLQINNVHSFQRPDATHLNYDPTRTSLNGHAGSVSFGKISGQKVVFNVNAGYNTPGYEVNDLGFQRRADEINQNSWLQWKNEKPTKRLRSKRINFNQWASWNFGGDRRSLGINVNAHAQFQNSWETGTGFNVNSEAFDDRLTRGGPGGIVTGGLSQWGYVDGDSRKAISPNVFLQWFNDLHDSKGYSVSPGVTIRPSTAISLSVGFNIDRNISDAQWVENIEEGPATHYVFGRIDQTTVSISTRLNYTIRPTISLQLYAQPFVSAGDYSRFKELTAPRAEHYEDRYSPFAYANEPDFNFQSFRTTNVLRWEYKPGSALFVVWQSARQGVKPYGTFSFGRDFGDAFGAPATGVFLVKISRWFNY